MKNVIFSRSVKSIIGQPKKSILSIMFCAIFGLALSTSIIYFSTNDLYMSEIDKTYPLTLSVSLAENASDSEVDKLEEIIKTYANVTEYEKMEQNIFMLTMTSHSVEEESMQYLSSFTDDFETLAVENATDITTIFLLESINTAVGFQKIIICVFMFTLFVFFAVLYVNNTRKFNKHANILLLLGEKKQNIAKQFLIEQNLFLYITINLFMLIGLAFKNQISAFWINSATTDVDTYADGVTLITSYESHGEYLFSVVNTGILSCALILFASMFALFVVLSIAGWIYYLNIKISNSSKT